MENPLKYINKKLLFVIAGTLISGFFLSISVYMMNSSVNTLNTSISIKNMLTDLRKQEDNFFESGKPENIEKFQNISKKLIEEIDRTIKNRLSKDTYLENLSEILHEYRNSFILVSNHILTIGKGKTYNLDDNFRKALYEIEKLKIPELENLLLKSALSQRSFISKHDAEYFSDYNSNLKKLKDSLKNLSGKKDILKALDSVDKYNKEFEKIYLSIPKISITSQKNVMDDMIRNRDKIEFYLKELGLSLKKTIRSSIKIMFVGMIMLFLTLLLGAVLITEILDKSRELKLIVEKKEIIESDLIEHKGKLESIVEERTKDLRKALKEVNILSGLLPICASCKKIRDDKGYWNQIEEYLSKHSEAIFSHSICPDCTKKLYPEFYEAILNQKKNKD